LKKPIPVTVVSGFLGSGKTTLLCDLLQHRQQRRLAVLINELGEVSIDGALARASSSCEEVEIVDFPSGLIAYAEDGQFVPTLQAIARRAGQVDHVLIETSGVALPTAAMARLQATELADDFVLDATLVVVDTPRLLAGEFDGGADAVGLLFNQQLAAADVVVLNKIDELDTDALLVAEEQVRKRAPNVRFLELAHHARLDVRLALGLRLHQVTASDRMRHCPITVASTGTATLGSWRTCMAWPPIRISMSRTQVGCPSLCAAMSGRASVHCERH
jgi:cobalamin biosynthesis protein CobW